VFLSLPRGRVAIADLFRFALGPQSTEQEKAGALSPISDTHIIHGSSGATLPEGLETSVESDDQGAPMSGGR
jgi:hypothetical protein